MGMDEPITPQNLPERQPVTPGQLPLRCSKWDKANRPYYDDTAPKRNIVPKGFAIIVLVVAIVLVGRRLPAKSTPADDSELLNKIALLQLTEADSFQGNLALVNSEFPYTLPLTEPTFTPVSLGKPQADKEAEGKLLPQAARALNRMLEAFATETGREIWVETGYRSLEEQREYFDNAALHKNACDEIAPGYNEHHTGLAVDLVSAGESAGTLTSQDAQWLQQHAASYGFIWQQQDGTEDLTGHFRYVGSPHAAVMKTLGLSLEEYLGRIQKKHSWNGDHLLCQAGDLEYEIYYVPVAEEGYTQVPVPKMGEYTWSGSNQGGFVVTTWQIKASE